MSVCCVVVAAGVGQRLGHGPKAMVSIAGRSLLSWALQGVWDAGVDQVVVVAPPDRVRLPDDLPHGGPLVVVAGGATRQESVRYGLAAAPADSDIVLVHDAARCFTPARVIADVVRAVREGHDVVIPGVAVTDTLRWRVAAPDGEGTGRTQHGPDREHLVAVQTPQGFRRQVLDHAHQEATRSGVTATDDATLAELLGCTVFIAPGDERGFKVTRPLDLLLAQAYAASLSAPSSIAAGGDV